MSYPAMFEDLPATFPTANRHKKPAAVGALAFHVLLVIALIVVPLALPQQIEPWRLLAMLAPLPPPPPAAPARGAAPAAKPLKAAPKPPKVEAIVRVAPGTMIAPVEIPKVIAHITDEGDGVGAGGVVGGVVGGVAGGVAGGVPNSLLTGLLQPGLRLEPAPPPAPPRPAPPPPPAAAPAVAPVKEVLQPVRVGGNVEEPRLIASVPPVYPPLALKSRVQATIVLEAVLTEQGAVDQLRIIAGHPLLNEAAIDAVRKWRYSPTYLNGIPVPVILTVSVEFKLARP